MKALREKVRVVAIPEKLKDFADDAFVKLQHFRARYRGVDLVLKTRISACFDAVYEDLRVLRPTSGSVSSVTTWWCWPKHRRNRRKDATKRCSSIRDMRTVRLWTRKNVLLGYIYPPIGHDGPRRRPYGRGSSVAATRKSTCFNKNYLVSHAGDGQQLQCNSRRPRIAFWTCPER